MYFKYGEKEIKYLKDRDKKLADVIEKVGFIKRETEPDIFLCIVHNIVGQQISNKALETVWQRFINRVGNVTAENVCNADLENIGISSKKIFWIKDFARKILKNEFDVNLLYEKSNDEAVKYLCSLNGVGKWTAEMVLIFSMNRINVLSYGDFGIKNGMKILYDKKEITKPLFEEYREMYSPYCSVASLYLWAVSGGALEKMP